MLLIFTGLLLLGGGNCLLIKPGGDSGPAFLLHLKIPNSCNFLYGYVQFLRNTFMCCYKNVVLPGHPRKQEINTQNRYHLFWLEWVAVVLRVGAIVAKLYSWYFLSSPSAQLEHIVWKSDHAKHLLFLSSSSNWVKMLVSGVVSWWNRIVFLKSINVHSDQHKVLQDEFILVLKMRSTKDVMCTQSGAVVLHSLK